MVKNIKDVSTEGKDLCRDFVEGDQMLALSNEIMSIHMADGYCCNMTRI